jgi:L-lactate dehydrogenase complex protein LldG
MTTPLLSDGSSRRNNEAKASARESFLSDIAARLGRPRLCAPPSRSALDQAAARSPLSRHDRSYVRFATELTQLGASCQIAHSLPELHALLRAELIRWGAHRLVSWSREELRHFEIDWLWNELSCVSITGASPHDANRVAPPVVASTRESYRAAALRAEVGITGVDFAVAETGSLAMSSGPGRPRSVSLLPSVHIALVQEAQILASLGEALTQGVQPGHRPPSAFYLVTGPSRTSDIENDHTIGVHGPAAVSVIVLGDSAAGPDKSQGRER